MEAPLPISACILAGGQSRRMGRDKSLIHYQGKSLIQSLVERLESLCSEVLISARNTQDYSELQKQVVVDPIPDIGPLAGCYAGVSAARLDWVLLRACDMPFLVPQLIEEQWRQAQTETWDVICPQSEGGLEPLHMLLHKRTLPAIQSSIRRKDYKLSSFFSQVRVKMITWNEVKQLDPQGQSFLNWNTPEDLDRFGVLPRDV